jgi:aspartate/methionine/tyrosine aminotransferase
MPAVPIMKPPAKAPQKMPRSGIREILDLASRLPDVIHLEIGEPDFATPEHIVAAAHDAMRAGFTRYTANAGMLSLREAIATKLGRRNRIKATPDQIVVTHGSMGGLALALLAILEPGDEVLVPDPGWPNYFMMASSRAISSRPYPLVRATMFQPDIAALESLVTSKTKAIIVNSPSNPTGAVFSEKTVVNLIECARRHDLYLVSDEAYEDIVFEGTHYSPDAYDNEGRTISVFSLSKSYAMTGWRIGYVAARPEIAALIAKLQEAYYACACSVSQKAAEAALTGDQRCVAMMRDAYRERRRLAISILERHQLDFCVPQGTFYMLVSIGQCGMDSYQFSRQLLEEEKVAVAPGATFGRAAEGFVRVSLTASPGLIEAGIENLCQFVHHHTRS